MVKIVNGQIVTEGETPSSTSTKSPFPCLARAGRRRSSIQELQLEELMKEQQAQKVAQEQSQTPAVDHPPPTWRECINEKVSVFGVLLAVKHLVFLSLFSIAVYGVQGLLVCLLAVYIGTLYTPKVPQKKESRLQAIPETAPLESSTRQPATINVTS